MDPCQSIRPQPNPILLDIRNELPDYWTPWKISDAIFTEMSSQKGKYKKVEVLPTHPEWRFLWRYFYHDKPHRWGISRIYCIHEEHQQQAFERNLSSIESKAKQFKPNKTEEPCKNQRAQRRRDWKETRILPLWHGTSKPVANSIADSGFVYSGKTSVGTNASKPKSTNKGFFGNGIYFTNSARYASDICSSGHLLLAWVSMRELFPVVGDPKEDMKTLSGQGAYKDYNAYYIPATSCDPSNAYEAIYYPAQKGESPHCDEIVVFQKSQTLPRFWIELQVESPYLMTPSVIPQFVEDFIPHLFKLLENSSVDSDKKLRNYLGEELAILLKLKGDDRLDNDGDKYETLYKKLTQLIDVQGKVNQQISRILIGASAQQAALPTSKPTLTSLSISNSFYSVMIDKTAKLNQLKTVPVTEFITALHKEPHQAALYCNFARILTPYTIVNLLNGTSTTQHQLFLKAIDLDPNLPHAYNNLGAILATAIAEKQAWNNMTEVGIRLLNGIHMTEQQFYLKAIDLDPSYPAPYFNLGNTLEAGTSIRLLNGTRMTKQQLFLKAIDLNPSHPHAYNNLGTTLADRASIQLLNGTRMTKQQLFLKAIDLDPNDSSAYSNLGYSLVVGDSIQLLNGTHMTEQQLYLKAIDLDPDCSDAYSNLGSTLAFGASIQLLNGTSMTQQQLFLKAIDLNPYSNAYYILGATLADGASILLLNGTRMTKLQLYLKAIDLDSNDFSAYNSLCYALAPGASIQLLNGTHMTQQQLVLKVIDLRPNFTSAYNNLGMMLATGASIQLLNGTRMTRQQLFLKAIDLNPSYSNAYNNLGYVLAEGTSIQLLNGARMTKQQLFLKAIDLNPNCSSAYSNLSKTLEVGDSIQLLNGTHMTKSELMTKGVKK